MEIRKVRHIVELENNSIYREIKVKGLRKQVEERDQWFYLGWLFYTVFKVGLSTKAGNDFIDITSCSKEIYLVLVIFLVPHWTNWSGCCRGLVQITSWPITHWSCSKQSHWSTVQVSEGEWVQVYSQFLVFGLFMKTLPSFVLFFCSHYYISHYIPDF